MIMENLLLMGIDTRPMVNSALKLDYRTFSISYFKTVDFKIPFMDEALLPIMPAANINGFLNSTPQISVFNIVSSL